MDKQTICNGIIQDEPCPIWNRALSAEEIAWMYEHADRPQGWTKENGKDVYYGPNGEKY